MIADPQVIEWLERDPDLFYLISNRLYPYGRLPQATAGQPSNQLPALTVRTISNEGHYTTNAPKAYQTARVQIDIWAETGNEALAVYGIVNHAMDGYRGSMTAMDVGGIFRNASPPVEFDPSLRLFHAILDYTLHILCAEERPT